MAEIEYKAFDKMTDEVAQDIFSLESLAHEKPFPISKLKRKTDFKNNLLILVAYSGSLPVGYKVGFEESERLFDSWIGGVHPEFRRKGIAKNLMNMQHERAKEMGYSFVRTHTKNSYREMLIFNIRYGFDVVGTYKSDYQKELIIMLEKALN